MNDLITIYRFDKDNPLFEVSPLKVKRTWMSESKNQFAYRCLPLNIANQYGWAVLSPCNFTISWQSGTDSGDISIEIDGPPEMQRKIMSYFGESIFTLHPDFLIRTPKGYSTYIRGIPNGQKAGIVPLDAIVETDWLPFPFTYNFKLTHPGKYCFKKGEPLFSFFPVQRSTVEKFDIREASIKEDTELFQGFESYRDYRKQQENGNYSNFYRKGETPDGSVDIENHTTKLRFKDLNSDL